MNPLTTAALLEFAGLPLHPLLVHATVVLTPLTAVALIVAALWPAARRRMGLALPAAALVVAVLAPVTVLAGQALADVVGRTPAVARHESLGLMLMPWAIALLPASVLLWWSGRPLPGGRRRARWVTIVVAGIAVVVAAVTIVLAVLTGDAGARAVWDGTV